MSKVITAAVLFGLVLSVAAPAAAQTVILVRHAEREDGGSDPALSAQGMVRAEILAARMGEAGVSHVFVTPYRRTQMTAAPTAAASGVDPRAFEITGGIDHHVASIADAVRAAGPDAVVLVVGHSNTVPAIARALGDGSAEALQECAYDRLVTLRMANDAPVVTRERYGAQSTC